MGRTATKASGNVWYQARIEAANWNERLQSRAGAAEEASMSEDSIKNTELGLEKCMPVEKAVVLADLYNAPQLLNHYCLNECPIGRNKPISDQVVPIESATIKFLNTVRADKLGQAQTVLMEIAEDGRITQEERERFWDTVDYLNTIIHSISELKIIAERNGHG